MTEVTIKLWINADPSEVYELLDDWVGRTAPVEVDSFQIEVES